MTPPVITAYCDGAQWRDQFGRYVPLETGNSFAIGATEPSATTNGPRAGVTRQNYAGSLTNVPAGTVLSGLNITGGGLKLANDNVTVRDVDIILPASTVQTSGIDVTDRDATNILIEHVRVSVPPENRSRFQSAGIRGRGFTAKFVDLSGTVDGIFAHGVSGDARMTVTLDAPYVHDLYADPNDPGQPDGISHCDALVVGGNVNVRCRGARLHGHTTSAVLITNDVAGGYDYVEVLDSWLYGSPTFGATVNVSSSISIPGLKVHRNRISRDGRTPRLLAGTPNRVAARWGMVGADGSTTGWTAGADRNYFMDDGSTAAVSNG